MPKTLRSLFPALSDPARIYLDSASTCQLPQSVIDAMTDYLATGHGNPHRAMYYWGSRAETLLQETRQAVADFIQATPEQIAFTSGTTESINLVAQNFRSTIDQRHSILVTEMEHHANLLPWQQLCKETGARLHILPLSPTGQLDLAQLENWLEDNCAIFALTHVSNVLGVENPVTHLCKQARAHGVATLVDGAQAVSHMALDMSQIDCDYYVFSGHKLYAAPGIGVLYSRRPDGLFPFKLGGGIVNRVTTEDFQLLDTIQKLEAGSPNMPAIVSLNAALEFLSEVDYLSYVAGQAEATIETSKLIADLGFMLVSGQDSQNMVSFTSDRFHSHDIASILAELDIAVRAGHHCAQPCLSARGTSHCVRASLGLYNEPGDLRRLIEGLQQAIKILS